MTAQGREKKRHRIVDAVFIGLWLSMVSYALAYLFCTGDMHGAVLRALVALLISKTHRLLFPHNSDPN